jgi:capsid protein
MRPGYKPYKPTKWEQRIDAALRIVAPKLQFNRVMAREREHYFKYLAAYPSASRRNATANTTGETMKGSREKLQVMWNAMNAVDNSGLCSGVLLKFMTYVCGAMRWQARTGDRVINNEYEDYIRLKLKAIDLTGRFSFRQMCMMAVRSILIKGDVGTNIVRDGRELFLQGIEADRIGNPYDYQISDNYVRGLVLSDEGLITAVKVFRRDRAKGIYVYDDTFPMRDAMGMPKFLFIVNPISYDDYRGVSVFKTAIDNATYIDRMRELELQALMWAASQSGVFHTQSGLLPEQLPFDSPSGIDASGNQLTTYQVRPNTVTALGVGEDVKMFQHDRPSPNVIGMVRDTIRDIAVGTGLSFEFVWDQSQLGGPTVRAVSAADARAIEMWQLLLLEQKLDPVTTLLLGNAIANHELPYHPQWQRWQWFFPPKGTIDVGRESQANIQEIDANINTGERFM